MKHRYFKHLLGGDDSESEQLYRWHITKRRASGFVDSSKDTLDQYTTEAKNLAASMIRDGFDPAYPIPIDADGELLGGAHRTACALALDIHVHVQPHDRQAWAPDWGFKWFVDQGMAFTDLIRLKADWKALAGHQPATRPDWYEAQRAGAE